MSNRSNIVNHIITNLKKIDGRTSPFSSSYVFSTNLYENVFRGLKYLDEINEFPAIYLQCIRELRLYTTANATEGVVELALRGYFHSDENSLSTNNIVSDIEHVLYNMDTNLGLQIQQITINEIIVDSGLLEPYGMVEIFLSVSFEINKF
jgi:hypothetical protein